MRHGLGEWRFGEMWNYLVGSAMQHYIVSIMSAPLEVSAERDNNGPHCKIVSIFVVSRDFLARSRVRMAATVVNTSQHSPSREDAHPTSRHEILLRSYGGKGKDEQQELELRGDSNKA